MALILECKKCGIYYELASGDLSHFQDGVGRVLCRDCVGWLQIHVANGPPPPEYIKYWGPTIIHNHAPASGSFHYLPGVWYQNPNFNAQNPHYQSAQAANAVKQTQAQQTNYNSPTQGASKMPPRPKVSYGSPPMPQSPPNYGGVGTNTTQQCSIRWNSQIRAYEVQVPYQPNFIEFIKARIPGSDRSWVPTTKIWVVTEKWLDVLRTLATELWGIGAVSVSTRKEVEDAEREQAEAMRTAVLASLPERERAIFELVELVPADAIKAMYRKAAMELHPDRQGGDAERMTKLNAAWTKVEKFLEEVVSK